MRDATRCPHCGYFNGGRFTSCPICKQNPEAQSNLPDQRDQLDARLAGKTRPADPEDIGAPHWKEE